jgi:hypothetical protein
MIADREFDVRFIAGETEVVVAAKVEKSAERAVLEADVAETGAWIGD